MTLTTSQVDEQEVQRITDVVTDFLIKTIPRKQYLEPWENP